MVKRWCACGRYLTTTPHQCDSRHLPPIESPPIEPAYNAGFKAGAAWQQQQDLAAVQRAQTNPPEYEGIEDHGWEDACIEIERLITAAGGEG